MSYWVISHCWIGWLVGRLVDLDYALLRLRFAVLVAACSGLGVFPLREQGSQGQEGSVERNSIVGRGASSLQLCTEGLAYIKV